MPPIKKVLCATTPLVVASGFLVMLFSLKTSIFFKLIWILLIPLLLLSYRVFQIKQLLLGLILTLFIVVGKSLPTTAYASPPDPLSELVPQLLISCLAPPELLDHLRGMDLPTLP